MAVIYGLVHVASGRTYVGCTAGKLNKRLREHRCLLNNRKHNEPILQREWSLYGSEAFRIEILETLPNEATTIQKREAELRWMAMMETRGLLYNRAKISFQLTPEAIRKGVANAHIKPGNRWSPEANEKRRIAQLGIPKGHGAKISATKRAKSQRADDEIV